VRAKYELTNVLATDLSASEVEDYKILCLLQDKTIRRATSDIIRRELRIRASTIAMARQSLPVKGETLKQCLDKRFPPRGRGGAKPKPESKLLDMTALGMELE